MNDLFEALGIKGSVLFAGLAGGILRALSRKQHSFREIVASPVCGALAAGYLTEPLVHYLRSVNFPLPPSDGTSTTMHAAAFVIGVCAMWLSDALFDAVQRRIRS